MSPNEFSELLSYIKENNSWGERFYETVVVRGRRAVKYVDAVFDSRDGRIFSITFRQGGGNKSFSIESKNDIDAVYSWLNEPIRGTKNTGGAV